MNKKEQEAADSVLAALIKAASTKDEAFYAKVLVEAYATLVGAAMTRDQLEQCIAHRQPPEPASEKPKAVFVSDSPIREIRIN